MLTWRTGYWRPLTAKYIATQRIVYARSGARIHNAIVRPIQEHPAVADDLATGTGTEGDPQFFPRLTVERQKYRWKNSKAAKMIAEALAWLRAQDEPKTLQEIAEAIEIDLKAFKDAFRYNKEFFECAGLRAKGNNQPLLWRAKDSRL